MAHVVALVVWLVRIAVNRANVLAFADAVRIRVFEVAFEQPPAGDAGIAFDIKQQRQSLADLAASVEPVDGAEVQPFLGIWSHPPLGEVNPNLQDGRLMFDVGDVASERAAVPGATAEGQVFVTVTPLLGGRRVSLQEEGGERLLVVHDPAAADLNLFAAEALTPATPVATPAR